MYVCTLREFIHSHKLNPVYMSKLQAHQVFSKYSVIGSNTPLEVYNHNVLAVVTTVFLSNYSNVHYNMTYQSVGRYSE